jgi:hypothetical protein
MYKEKNSNKFSAARGLHKFKELPPPFIVREIPALHNIYRKTQRGMQKKNDARVIVCFQAPPMGQRYLKGRRGIFVRKKNSWNAGIEAGDSKT